MDRLRAPVRPYPWGDTAFIADLQGRRPGSSPEAELWMGAHPSDPGVLEGSGRDLTAHIAADPEAALGDAAGFGELPFLAKVLAAAQPLSIQVHPSRAQAVEGFERENRRGLPLDDPARSYRDPHHKPELVCALTPFDAKCGFRPVAGTLELIAFLDHPGLRPLERRLHGGDDAEVLRDVLGWLLTAGASETTGLTDALVEACDRSGQGPWMAETDWTTRLHSLHPGDAGIVVALLLNHVHLEPGDGLALGAGLLHSYLHGAAVEVMANSDNVVRGGLTPKHVDVPELVRIVDCHPTTPLVDSPTGPIHTYRSGAAEFEVSRLVLDGHHGARVVGPEILVVTEGSFQLTGADRTFELGPGQPIWIDAADGHWSADGTGTLFRVTTPSSSEATNSGTE